MSMPASRIDMTLHLTMALAIINYLQYSLDARPLEQPPTRPTTDLGGNAGACVQKGLVEGFATVSGTRSTWHRVRSEGNS
jgi:hypothetical protein